MLARRMQQQAFKPCQVARRATAPVVRRALPVVCLAAAEPASTTTAEPASTSTGPKSGVARMSFQRGSVFKVRRVLDTIRGRSYEEALILMEYMPYKACEKILKALISAAANAKHNSQASKSKLKVTECFADQGPYLKRIMPRAKGRACPIHKPTFHLTVKLEETQ